MLPDFAGIKHRTVDRADSPQPLGPSVIPIPLIAVRIMAPRERGNESGRNPYPVGDRGR